MVTKSEHFKSGGCYSSYREKDDEEYAKNNHKTIIDYKNFDRSGTISRARFHPARAENCY